MSGRVDKMDRFVSRQHVPACAIGRTRQQSPPRENERNLIVVERSGEGRESQRTPQRDDDESMDRCFSFVKD